MAPRKRTPAYHPVSDDWRIFPIACEDPGSQSVPMAHKVMQWHIDCAGDSKCKARPVAVRTLNRAGHLVPSSRHSIGAAQVPDVTGEGIDKSQLLGCMRSAMFAWLPILVAASWLVVGGGAAQAQCVSLCGNTGPQYPGQGAGWHTHPQYPFGDNR